jgi:hypothetical protein
MKARRSYPGHAAWTLERRPRPRRRLGTAVNPANIKRVVRELPPNYEVIPGVTSCLGNS